MLPINCFYFKHFTSGHDKDSEWPQWQTWKVTKVSELDNDLIVFLSDVDPESQLSRLPKISDLSSFF